MIIVKISKARLTPTLREKIKGLLRAGGVIIYPTDTAYALGGIFNSKKVIKKILAIKKRKDDKFTLIASSRRQVEKFFKLNATAKNLAKKYWPGPLSLVVSKKYAVRVPDNVVARKLARLAGIPLIATSANVHGEQTPYDVKEIVESFYPSPQPSPTEGGGRKTKKKNPLPLWGRMSRAQAEGQERGDNGDAPNLILDAGKLKKRKTSTIVEVSGDRIQIIRPGTIEVII